MVSARTQDLKKRSQAHVFQIFGTPGTEPELIL